MEFKEILKKTWYFIWEDDSILSWIVNIILAFIIIKFIVYPGLGLILGTNYPIVAVVSGSMQHFPDENNIICGKIDSDYVKNFDNYWKNCGEYYENMGIKKDEFLKYPYKNGFNKGDIMFLYMKKNIVEGDIVVFQTKRPDPIIHRMIKINNETKIRYETKGDHNQAQIVTYEINEKEIYRENILGTPLIRIPYVGYIKIWFVQVLYFITGRVSPI